MLMSSEKIALRVILRYLSKKVLSACAAPEGINNVEGPETVNKGTRIVQTFQGR